MKLVKKFGRKILMIYWRFAKPLSLGARILVTYKNQVLLVKHTYINGYFLPGGGIKKSELAYKAALRELSEEVGIKAHHLQLFGVYQSTLERKYTLNVVYLYKVTEKPLLKIQSDELIDARFFDMNKLPKDVSPGTQRRIEEFTKKTFPLTTEW